MDSKLIVDKWAILDGCLILFYFSKDGYVQFGSVKFHSLDKLLIGLTLEESKGRVVFKLVSPKVPGLSEEEEELENPLYNAKR